MKHKQSRKKSNPGKRHCSRSLKMRNTIVRKNTKRKTRENPKSKLTKKTKKEMEEIKEHKVNNETVKNNYVEFNRKKTNYNSTRLAHKIGHVYNSNANIHGNNKSYLIPIQEVGLPICIAMKKDDLIEIGVYAVINRNKVSNKETKEVQMKLIKNYKKVEKILKEYLKEFNKSKTIIYNQKAFKIYDLKTIYSNLVSVPYSIWRRQNPDEVVLTEFDVASIIKGFRVILEKEINIQKENESDKNVKFKVLVVGGGPVGLSIAKLLGESGVCNVDIYEKRKEYTRRQYLLISRNSSVYTQLESVFNFYWYETRYDYCGIANPNKDYLGLCPRNSESFVSIPIKKFEDVMKKYLEKNTHIKFHEQEINDKSQLKGYDLVIGCEGGDSFIRDNVLQSKEFDDGYESYGMILNYNEKNISKFNRGYLDYRYDNNIDQNRLRFFRGPTSNAYIGFQLSFKEYNKYKDKKKYGDLSKTDKKLFENYFDLYKSEPTDNLKNEPIETFKIKHKYYDIYGDYINGQMIMICGDAVSQPHFFTASGLELGYDMVYTSLTHLIEEIPELLKKSKKEVNVFWRKFVQNYNKLVQFELLNYRGSTRTGYNRWKLASKICEKMDKENWNEIKNQMYKVPYGYNKSGSGYRPIKMKLKWFDDDEETCKLFANHIVDRYAYLLK